MINQSSLELNVAKIFKNKLNLIIPSKNTDLFESGSLDSLSLVSLLYQIELEYGIKISLEELEIEHFQSIEKIAEFLLMRLSSDVSN